MNAINTHFTTQYGLPLDEIDHEINVDLFAGGGGASIGQGVDEPAPTITAGGGGKTSLVELKLSPDAYVSKQESQMKKTAGIVLMLLPIQFLAGQVAIINGATPGDLTWWISVVVTGFLFSVGRDLAGT